MAKGKFKLQYENQHDSTDRRWGNKQWLPVWSCNRAGTAQTPGYSMTRDSASAMYHEMRRHWPDVNYRIKECR